MNPTHIAPQEKATRTIPEVKLKSKKNPPKDFLLSKVFQDGTIVESVYQPNNQPALKFAVGRKDEAPSIQEFFTFEGTEYFPIPVLVRSFERGTIKVPSGLADYESTSSC